jgi:hypothetical protein
VHFPQGETEDVVAPARFMAEVMASLRTTAHSAAMSSDLNFLPDDDTLAEDGPLVSWLSSVLSALQFVDDDDTDLGSMKPSHSPRHTLAYVCNRVEVVGTLARLSEAGLSTRTIQWARRLDNLKMAEEELRRSMERHTDLSKLLRQPQSTGR